MVLGKHFCSRTVQILLLTALVWPVVPPISPLKCIMAMGHGGVYLAKLVRAGTHRNKTIHLWISGG